MKWSFIAMATIRENNGRFSVLVRKRGQSHGATFDTREMAELWGQYKEEIIHNMEMFKPPEKEMILLKDAFDLKIAEMTKENKDKRSIADYHATLNLMSEYQNKEISFFDYNFYQDLMEKWKNLKIFHGGNHKDINRESKLPSIKTLIRRFAILSAIYQFLREKGVDIENHPQKITTFLRQQDKGEKE